MSAAPLGVLLMAYGGPGSLDEVEPYLLDVRGGRPTPPRVVEEVRERYRRTGGRSPLAEITRAAARALAEGLNAGETGGRRFRTYVGMRHWQPRIRAAIEEMAADGVERAVGICMAPHYSAMSIGAYVAKVEEACREVPGAPCIEVVRSWHLEPAFLGAVARRVREALERWNQAGPQPGPHPGPHPLSPSPPPVERGNAAGTAGQEWGGAEAGWGGVRVLFTAHSLPERVLAEGDPYQEQLLETGRAVAARVGLADAAWRLVYQSKGQLAEPWLGPAVEDAIVQEARAGRRNLLVAPIGFVADHVEILYDVDIVCRAIAAEHGARLERTESLNAAPDFVAALANLARARLGVVA